MSRLWHGKEHVWILAICSTLKAPRDTGTTGTTPRGTGGRTKNGVQGIIDRIWKGSGS